MRAVCARAVIVTVVSASLVAGIVASESANATGSTTACNGKDLTGSFKRIPGSGSLGHVGYQLNARNRADHSCFVKDLPKMRLLGRQGRALPTHVLSAGTKASKVVLKPGETAAAVSRFAEIPTGEDRQSGNCQPTAFKARVGVRPGVGKFVVSVKPHIAVCGRGALTFRPFRRIH